MDIITLEEAKEWLKLDADYDLENSLIKDLIKTSIAWCEQYTGLSFMLKEYTKVTNCKRIELIAPVSSITSVLDMNFNVIEYFYSDNTIYQSGKEIMIKYKSGFAPELLPAPIKSAVKMMISTLYDNREAYVIGDKGQTLVEMPIGITALLRPYSRSGGLFL